VEREEEVAHASRVFLEEQPVAAVAPALAWPPDQGRLQHKAPLQNRVPRRRRALQQNMVPPRTRPKVLLEQQAPDACNDLPPPQL